jgi:hypothetical protein
MNRHIKVALALGFLVGAAACDDGYLVTEPQDIVSDQTFWKSERDFTLAVNAAYRDVIDQDQIYFDGATDIMYSQKDWTRNHAYAQGQQDALTGWSIGVWNRLFEGVSRVNDVLDRLETTEAKISPEARTQIEAQARFLRGYFYHELLWLYGGVPLYTKVPTVEEARSATRASREEVLAFIMADLKAAAEGLPTKWPSSEYGRATRGAALAYQARAALYEASYQKYAEGNAALADELFRAAADAAKAVMDGNAYSLHPSYRELFTYSGEGSAEVIFDYQHVKGVNGWAAWAWLAPNSMGGDIDLTPTRAIVDRYLMKDGLPIGESPLYDPTPPVIQDGEVVSLGMYANRDPRLYAAVLFPGAQFNGAVYNSFPDSPTPDRVLTSNFSNTHTGYLSLKYVDPADQAGRTDSGLNIILMRYADVLLMYAEAKTELGEVDKTVYDALDAIRDRAAMPHVEATSQERLLETIRNERAVELAFEGLRLADIRRWRIAEAVMPGNVQGIDVRQDGGTATLRGIWQRAFTAPRDYLWPIPAPERDLDPALNQNTGY